jgi:hypothetical protein
MAALCVVLSIIAKDVAETGIAGKVLSIPLWCYSGEIIPDL